MDISRATSRSVEQVPNLGAAQIVAALTPEARKACPKPSKALCIEWTIDDPSQLQGEEQRRAAYEKTFQSLRTQISDLREAVLGDAIDWGLAFRKDPHHTDTI
jgi:protein-tyrosine-phosphatase